MALRSVSLIGHETKLHTKSVHAPEKRVVLGVFEPSENSCDGRLRKFPKNDVVVSTTPIRVRVTFRHRENEKLMENSKKKAKSEQIENLSFSWSSTVS